MRRKTFSVPAPSEKPKVMLVSIGVLVLRVREPGLPRRFKTPWVWFVGPMGAISAIYLMVSLPWTTWLRLIIWFVIGMVVYFSYSVGHSRLAGRSGGSGTPPVGPASPPGGPMRGAGTPPPPRR